MASATRARSPPDNESARRWTSCPENPNRPKCPAEPLNQRAWWGADPHAHVLRADDLITAALRDFEAHRHRPFRTDDGAEPRQPLEPLAPAFGLFGILPSDVARDVILLVRD